MPYTNLERRRESARKREKVRRTRLRETKTLTGQVSKTRFAEFLQRALGEFEETKRWSERLAEAMGEGPEYDRSLRRYLDGESRCGPENAFRIGAALRSLGVRWSSGPAALYGAGHIADLVRFFASLAKLKAKRLLAGQGCDRVALLFCNLWSTDFSAKSPLLTKLTGTQISAFTSYAADALGRLDPGATSELVDEFYADAWAATRTRAALDPLPLLAVRAAETLGSSGIDGAWLVLKPWVERIAPRSFPVYAPALAARETLRVLTQYGSLPLTLREPVQISSTKGSKKR